MQKCITIEALQEQYERDSALKALLRECKKTFVPIIKKHPGKSVYGALSALAVASHLFIPQLQISARVSEIVPRNCNIARAASPVRVLMRDGTWIFHRAATQQDVTACKRGQRNIKIRKAKESAKGDFRIHVPKGP